LLEVFEQTGIAGKITWFLNENGFHILQNHESFLHKALQAGDTFALHDHIDWLKGDWDKDKIKEYCAASKSRIENWLSDNGAGKKILFHRNGCLFQHPQSYHALQELGYQVLSDVYPGYKGNNHTGFVACDNRDMPIGIDPYHHDPDNYMDYTSEMGHFLHIPACNMGLNPYLYKRTHLSSETIKHWLASRENKDNGVFCWLFHPYEIMKSKDGYTWASSDRNDISDEMVDHLKTLIENTIPEYGFGFVNMEEYYSRIMRT
jgi:hypothetical protein